MKSIRRAKLVMIVVVLLLLMMPFGAAWATPPVRETWDVGWDDFELADCGDFQVLEHLEAKVEVTFFYDKDGELVRWMEHWTASGYAYNSNDPNIWLPEEPIRNVGHFDGPTGDGHIAGPLMKIKLPREGMIFHQVGYVEVEGYTNWIFKAGQNDLLGGNAAELCAALAP
jgi:hypothetical protein